MSAADLAIGVAQYLAGGYHGVWRASGKYEPTEGWPLFFGHRPSKPDMVISVTPYPVEDSPHLSDSTVGIQVWARGDSDPAAALRKLDDIFQDLHGLTSVELNGVRVVQALRKSSSSQGRDQGGRWEHADNYYFDIWKPTPHRE